MTDKSKAVWKFISKCPLIPGYLTFNSIEEFVGSTGLIPVSSEDSIQEYTDGSKKIEYIFAITQMKPFDTGTNETNLVSLADMQAFVDWVKAQDAAGNYPEFPDNCIIESIEPLQNMPDLAGVDASMVAKYMFQFRIIYIQEV